MRLMQADSPTVLGNPSKGNLRTGNLEDYKLTFA